MENEVYRSKEVENSNYIDYCRGVKDSQYIVDSAEVYNSNYVYTANRINNCSNMWICAVDTNCSDCYRCVGCNDIHYCVDCNSVTNAIFCNNISNHTYCIFNTDVTEIEFLQAKEYLTTVLKPDYVICGRDDRGYPYFRVDWMMLLENDEFLYAITKLPHYSEDIINDIKEKLK